MRQPFISVIIPVRELNNYLFLENFPAFQKQSYKHFEVIVLPNSKSQKDKIFLKKYHWLRIIPTPNISRPAEKRDIGAKNAEGSVLAFIDDDAYPSPDWLEKSTYYFDSKKTEVICGPGVIPTNINIWEKIFDEILTSPVGSGGYQYRFIKAKPRFTDDYPSMNFLIQKKVFQQLGGFNSEYWPGEDSKLCEDLVYKYKGKIYYNPNILVYHHRRNTLIGFLKQHANYGFHRGAFSAHGDRNSRRLSYFIPTFFVFYLFFLSFFLFFDLLNFPNFILLIPFLIYVLFGFLLIIQSFIKTKNIVISLVIFPVLFLTHITYGTMFIKGFIKGLISKKQIYA